MFGLFYKKPNAAQPKEKAQFYIGVAADEYGCDFNLAAFVQGKFDEKFKNNLYFNVFIGNKIFDNIADAVKQTNRRGITDNSAYVIGLKCTINEIDKYREKGEFSSLIYSITNAMTGKAVSNVSENIVLKNESKDNKPDKPHSPSVQVK